ncbi:MAG: ExeM/NucH family extracellular endonuclease [Caldilineaceae bacterium]
MAPCRYGGADYVGISRLPDGADTNNNSVDFSPRCITPGAANSADSSGCPPPDNGGGGGGQIATFDAATLISAVQGDGPTSPLNGQNVIIEGVVVGDFQNNASLDNGDLNGFHVQDPLGDGEANTSDGIFVHAPNGMDVSVGDAVRVRGAVSEFNGLTEVTAAEILVCSTGNSVAPTNISLPVSSVDDFEKYEGMLVTFPQSLVISEYFNFDRFGEIVLTSERHLTPSAEFEPGPAAIQAAQEFLLDKITLDDGRGSQNPDPAIHPNGANFDLNNLFRGGDTVANVTGVMDYAFSLYRIQPTQGADYTNTNPRTAAPDSVGDGLKVASFNVLNYFTTFGSRGANDDNEFQRQRAKIFAALQAIDADIVGLIEIENNGAALTDLVDGLNNLVGAGTYAAINTGPIGTDEIVVAFIYKPAAVSTVGNYAVLDSTVDARFIDTKNRPVLAQTFQDNNTGGIFTVAVNHLKSKGTPCDDVGDFDLVTVRATATRPARPPPRRWSIGWPPTPPAAVMQTS